MPGFIRQKAALPTREPSIAKRAAAAPSKKRSAPINLTSSPTKVTSKKRPSPDSPTSPFDDTTVVSVKKTRTTSPTTSSSEPQKPLSPNEEPIPSSLPANGSDYIHDPSGLLSSLMEAYTVNTMQIISSSKMSAKIARSLDALVLGKINLADVKCKPGLMVMYTKAATASKLVSIVEIIKREIASKGEKWFQYNALGETMVVIPRKIDKSKKGGKKEDKHVAMEEGEGEGEEDDGAYFETMKTKQERVLEGTDRMRAVPVLTVYLSRLPIEKLKVKYGEQTNGKI